MTQTPSPKHTCDYQVANWNEEYRTCDRTAVRMAEQEDKPAFYYCQQHFDKAEAFLASRHVRVNEV